MLLKMENLKHNHCFVCSKENLRGLRVDFKLQENKVVGVFTPTKDYQSYEGITHGGVLSSLLDAAMNRAILEKGYVAQTGKLEIRFLQNAPIGHALTVIGEVVKARESFLLTKGVIYSSDNSEVAASEGIFFLK
jgi:uncharacterized protein (TIGR00369 family)